MASEWRDLLEWGYEGERFEDTSLPLDVLPDLVALRKLIMELTKTLWRRANPERERLSPKADALLDLRVFGLVPGSTVVPIRYRAEVPDAPPLPLDGVQSAPDPADLRLHLEPAGDLVVRTVESAAERRNLPADLPQDAIPLFKDLIGSVRDGEVAFVRRPGKGEKRCQLTRETLELIMSYAEGGWADQIDIVGHVTKASLRGQATVDVEGVGAVDVRFEPEQERVITHALHEHDRVMVRVKGRGTFDPNTGRVKAVEEVESIQPLETAQVEYDTTAVPLWQTISEIAKSVPDEAWSSVPEDLSERVDEYAYPGGRDSQDDS